MSSHSRSNKHQAQNRPTAYDGGAGVWTATRASTTEKGIAGMFATTCSDASNEALGGPGILLRSQNYYTHDQLTGF